MERINFRQILGNTLFYGIHRNELFEYIKITRRYEVMYSDSVRKLHLIVDVIEIVASRRSALPSRKFSSFRSPRYTVALTNITRFSLNYIRRYFCSPGDKKARPRIVSTKLRHDTISPLIHRRVMPAARALTPPTRHRPTFPVIVA